LHFLFHFGQKGGAKGFTRTNDSRRYLGVALIHGRIKNALIRYIVDEAQQRLAGWKVDKLSLAGRVALCQSVIQALPLYTMQSAKSSKI
jgi:hypothetical protein